MVHALTKAYRLLKPHGVLLDIHPHETPPPIEVRVGNITVTAGWLREDDDYIEYVQANAAIETVIAQKLFTIERAGTYNYIAHYDSPADLNDYVQNERSNAYIEPLVIQKIADLMAGNEPDQEIILNTTIRILRLLPLTA